MSLETWHPNQTSSWLEDGNYLLDVPYSMDVELVRDLLKYGGDVEVLPPPELRRHVADALRSAASKYAT